MIQVSSWCKRRSLERLIFFFWFNTLTLTLITKIQNLSVFRRTFKYSIGYSEGDNLIINSDVQDMVPCMFQEHVVKTRLQIQIWEFALINLFIHTLNKHLLSVYLIRQ